MNHHYFIMAGKIPPWVLFLVVFAAVIGGLVAIQYLAVPPAPAVKCAPVLAQTYKLEGASATVPIVFKDSIQKQPVSGVNVYQFEQKPYYWDRTNRFSYVSSMISGQNPVSTSDASGKANISVSVPRVQEGSKTYYIIAVGQGVWSELFEANVGFTPSLVAQSEMQCLQLFKKTDISAADLIDVSLTRVLDGSSVPLTDILLDKIGTIDVPANVSLGITQNKTANQITKTINIFVSDGTLRIDRIEFSKLIQDLKTEGIQRIEVQIMKGGTVLLSDVLYDSINTDTPLYKESSKTYNDFGGRDLILVGQNEGISIQLKIVADTSTGTATAGDGLLEPGEQFLAIRLGLPSPLEAQPIQITVQG